MLTVNKILAGGQGLAAALVRRAATVTLDWDLRQKSRFEAEDDRGRRLGVFLPRGTQVRGGDLLVAEDGSLVKVIAAPQPVMVVTHCPQHGSPFDLLRAAYHLGNRHVPLALQPDRLLFEPDPVLAQMLRRMHLIVTETEAPFEPEGGAYGGGHGHGHGHDHDHDHGPGHGHDAAHGHAHGHDHDHDHGHGHAHAHRHDHDHGHDHGDGHRHGHGHGHAHAHGHDHGHDHAPGHVHGPGCGHAHAAAEAAPVALPASRRAPASDAGPADDPAGR